MLGYAFITQATSLFTTILFRTIQKVYAEHTYQHRFEEMLKIISTI